MEHWRVVEQIDDRNSRRFPHQDGFHLANIGPTSPKSVNRAIIIKSMPRPILHGKGCDGYRLTAAISGFLPLQMTRLRHSFFAR